MTYSLNELVAMARRAARGAGLSWGSAQEAAFATRWLASNGLNGAALLARFLNDIDQIGDHALAPQSVSDIWKAQAGNMSALNAGMALSDSVASLDFDEAIRMENLYAPLFLAPYLAIASDYLGKPLCASWEGATLCTDGETISFEGDESALYAPLAPRVVLAKADSFHATQARSFRAEIEDVDWENLKSFAHRTYAPATEESRLRGAGAGVNDND